MFYFIILFYIIFYFIICLSLVVIVYKFGNNGKVFKGNQK